jgi:peptidoglycan biosynthesis protein MviN/MurJ (putative lipid II flippase)
LAALAGCAAYFASRAGWLGALGSDLRNFFLLITGAAIGTWLSFSLRREVLTFEDLAVLERDQLDPGTRVVFIAGLVVVAGLLFWSRAITVGIGDFGTFEAMHQHGSWALLAGLLAGIAERALATVVSKRAGDFAGAIGGKTTA